MLSNFLFIELFFNMHVNHHLCRISDLNNFDIFYGLDDDLRTTIICAVAVLNNNDYVITTSKLIAHNHEYEMN